jgi:hypothetical protein
VVPRPSSRSRQVDPELLRQIAAAERRRAGAAGEEVQAVLFLTPPTEAGAEKPASVIARVKRLLGRVQRARHERPSDVNVFGNLGSFVVQASPAFVRALIEQPEIRSARANRPRPRAAGPG